MGRILSFPRHELHREISTYLRDLELEERGRCLWLDLAGPSGRHGSRRARRPVAAEPRAGGDFLFLLPGGRAACLELGDHRGGRRREAAREAERRCERLGAPYAVARSLDELRRLLVEWGVLLPGEA